MSSVVRGDDNVIESPLAKVPNILEDFIEWFEAMQLKKPLVPELLEIEKQNLENFGPRSIAKPWSERIEGVEAYFNFKDKTFPELELPTGTGRLRPLSLQTASDYIKKTTNSGLPYLEKKGNVMKEAIANFEELLARQDPAVLFTRTTEKRKTRPVWGLSIADILNEMRYLRPALEHQKQSGYRSAVIGPDAINSSVSEMLKYAYRTGKYILSIDFSAYDTSISPELSKLAFEYIKSLYQAQYSDEIDYIYNRFISVGLVTPDGVYVGEHGVPSGSAFTNEIDSLVQYIIAMNYPGEKIIKLEIQGDDGLYIIGDPWGLMEWFGLFGLVVNFEKSLISLICAMFLQLFFHPDYEEDGELKGVYSVCRAFVRMCFPDGFTDFQRDDIEGNSYWSIRDISVAENCKYHPWFEEFVEFIYSKDKYKLHISEQSLTNYIKMRDREDGRDINFNIYQYGDYARGLKNFESYKLVRKLVENSL